MKFSSSSIFRRIWHLTRRFVLGKEQFSRGCWCAQVSKHTSIRYSSSRMSLPIIQQEHRPYRCKTVHKMHIGVFSWENGILTINSYRKYITVRTDYTVCATGIVTVTWTRRRPRLRSSPALQLTRTLPFSNQTHVYMTCLTQNCVWNKIMYREQ